MSFEYSFRSKIDKHKLSCNPVAIDTLQVNITRLCNQACKHCHVNASPKRKEQMNEKTILKCLEILNKYDQIKNLDLTGGAPELNPMFDFFVTEARKAKKHVMVRHNLTVTLDQHPLTKNSMEYLPRFFRENKVEVVSSLPYYQKFFTDNQRGKGVFEKSIESIKLLNKEGFGIGGTGLQLNLVYNPAGAFLPASQCELKSRFQSELETKFGIYFNDLYVITNMPINRFKMELERKGCLTEYMDKLVQAFNPSAAEGIMCRNLISVGYDGKLYDCDFNQMLGMQIKNGKEYTVFNFDFDELMNRDIKFDSHCFGCTAGSGSSCGGETA
ncbi:MAG: arsenosugar biosynthesis radical SAM (seleno)protein ArsS [Rhodothermaceae bacterium]